MGLLRQLAKRASIRLDENNQPPPSVNWRRVEDRQVDELVGLCKGFLADGVVDVDEARYLPGWLERNRHARDRWPANAIYPRLHRMLADGVLDASDERELLELLLKAKGGEVVDPDTSSMSTTLPLTDPPPTVEFIDRGFCCTGKFVSGSRSWLKKEIETRGGVFSANPTRKTHYLVIGLLGSRDWAHSTHGRKIEKAINIRDSGKGVGLVIVSEEQLVEFL